MINFDVHSIYSAGKSVITFDKLIEKAKENNQSHLALTDDNGIYGSIKFFNLCKDNDIVPIIGVQLNFCDSISIKEKTLEPIILLAKNLNGYRNLCRIISESYIYGFFYTPRVDFNILKTYSDDIICLSGPINGPICQAFLDDKKDYAEFLISNFRSIFGNRFIFELNPYSNTNYGLYAKYIAENFGDSYLITNNARYLNANDYDSYDIINAVSNKLKYDSPKRRKSNIDEYFKTEKEIYDLGFGLTRSQIDRGIKFGKDIAQTLCIEFEKKLHFPTPSIPNGMTSESFIKELINKGFKSKQKDLKYSDKKNYKDRIYYELKTINQFGFADYFLVVQEIINWAKSESIPIGPGRGSVGGSLIAYLLGITEVDPIRYNLIFERFLNPVGDRITMPDIDFDISDRDREKVVSHIENKYGNENVAAVGATGTLALKSSIKDVARSLDIEFERANAYTKLVPFKVNSMSDLLKDKNVKMQLLSNAELKRLFEMSEKIQGSMKNLSTHASGIVVSPTSIQDYSPIQHVKDKKSGKIRVTTQLDKDQIESLGLLKIDALGLTALRTIKTCLDAIEIRTKQRPNLASIDLDDSQIYSWQRKGLTSGLFQLEGQGITDMAKAINPVCLNDIRDINALYRPAVLEGGYQNLYIENKQNGTFSSIHPELTSILKETYGVCLFQEQTMLASVKMAGFSYSESDKLRKIIAKKNKAGASDLKKKFVDGCLKNNISKADAERVFGIFEDASYQFNASHSLAYGIITARTSWLKTFYTKEFMASCLSSEMEKDEELVKKYVKECKLLKINILQPSINNSEYNFSIDQNDNLIWGLGGIKNVGKGFVDLILLERNENGGYQSVDDFISRMSKKDLLTLNLSKIKVLSSVGCFDELEPNRALIDAKLNSFLSVSKKKKTTKPTIFDLEDLVEELEEYKIVDYTVNYKKIEEMKHMGVSFT